MDGTQQPGDRPRDGADGPLATVDQLIAEHVGLADAIARRFRVRGHDPDDLRQVARLGLVLAAHRYRPREGAGFVQFAVPTIAGTVKHYLRDQSWVVRPPRSAQELYRRVREVRAQLTHQLGREPTTAELAVRVGTTRGQVARALLAGAALTAVPLDESSQVPSGALEGAAGFEDVLLRHDADTRTVRAALADLDERDRLMLQRRFVDELTQAQIAVELGVSQMQVSRALARILSRLRRAVPDDVA